MPLLDSFDVVKVGFHENRTPVTLREHFRPVPGRVPDLLQSGTGARSSHDNQGPNEIDGRPKRRFFV